MAVAGAAIQWRRASAWSAAALTAYYTLFVLILMDGPVLLAHYAEYGAYEGISMQVAVAVGGLIVYAATANINVILAARLRRLGQLAIGACSLVWGGAHLSI